jgi:hypothetical protein
MARARKSALAKRYGKPKVQTLLFPHDWSAEDARVWATLHGFKATDVDNTESHIRIHQTRGQGKAKRVKTIPFGTGGIRAAVEWRK